MSTCWRPHLTCHVLAALACLGSAAPKPIPWLEPWRDPDRLICWLEERDWGERVAWTGNEIMNVGTLLQYARDFQQDPRWGRTVQVVESNSGRVFQFWVADAVDERVDPVI